MERGIQYLRELAMQEMVYYDPDNAQLPIDPDEVHCTGPMWHSFVQCTPPVYAKSLAGLAWKEAEAPTVNEVAGQLRQYEDSLSSSLRACVSAVERLSKISKNLFNKLYWEVRQLKEYASNSPLVWTSISAVRRILEVITDWPEGKDFRMSPEEEVTRAEEAPPYNKLIKDEKPYALFTDGSCRIMGKHRRWKPAVWSPTQRVAEAAEGEGESSQFAEVKAIQLALDIAEKVANTLPLY
ncbi:hypothetical protein GRJ2_003485300 [Grus japonensis]|uniref:RNase H type-1 domain-containing protein n=1 Tax=Grus japonensis TaxID=30415 RepID=A0ABC9YL43_GRUJA